MTSRDVLDAHRAAGRRFEAAGVGSFVREPGEGDPVVCLHGVPASSFLYRKVLAELVAHGLRGVAFDLPGLASPTVPRGSTTRGPASAASAPRPSTRSASSGSISSSTTSVGRSASSSPPDARTHRSLTVLDTLVEVDTFTRPWSMEPFARQGIGELYLRA